MDQISVTPALVMPTKPVRDYCMDPSRANPCLPSCCKPHYPSDPKAYGPPEIKPNKDRCENCLQEQMRDQRHEHDYEPSSRCRCRHTCNDSCPHKPRQRYNARHSDDSYDARQPYHHDHDYKDMGHHKDMGYHKDMGHHKDMGYHKDMGHHNDSYQHHNSGNQRDSRSPRGSAHYCTCPEAQKTVETKYIIPCYRYEDGRIVRELPVSAFKRNGMQDQEYSKLLGTANYLLRDPQDISINCNISMIPVKVCDPAKVPECTSKHKKPFDDYYLRKKPIEISLEDIVD